MNQPTDALRPQGLHVDLPIQDKLDVRRFSVSDSLSRLFRVELEVMSDNPAIDLEDLVGKDGAFRIDLGVAAVEGSDPAVWTGVVSAAHLVRSEPTGLSRYALSLSPRLWLLTQRTNCRVFQQMTDLEVAVRLLDEWGIRPMVECSSAYKTRKYRVQYQETDYAFFCRLLEAAGITHYFRVEGGETALVLTDAPGRARTRSAPLKYVDSPSAMHTFATGLRASRYLVSGKVTLSDHDHRLQNQPLLAHAKPSEHAVEAQLERFAYLPGAFRYGVQGSKETPAADDRGRTRTDEAEAARTAHQIGAALLARSRNHTFESNALDLRPGMRMSLVDHPFAERVGAMLVTQVDMAGTHDEMARVTVRTIAADMPYKPDQVTPVPTINGVESATVVGPAGETIHCDEFGRVRVQFHWDRYGTMDEMSSCWVPVNQAWAGDALGSINLPRIGQEVLVSFLAGNPEEPVIVGRIFTHLKRPPFALPANKTQSGFKSASVPATGGYNELMFEDKAGEELVRMRAEKDWSTRVNNDKTLSVGRNDSERIGGHQRHFVADFLQSVVGSDKVASVVGNFLSMTGGDRLLDTVGAMVTNALTHTITSRLGTTLKVGASTIQINPDSIIIQSPKILLNPGEDVVENAALAQGGE